MECERTSGNRHTSVVARDTHPSHQQCHATFETRHHIPSILVVAVRVAYFSARLSSFVVCEVRCVSLAENGPFRQKSVTVSVDDSSAYLYFILQSKAEYLLTI